MLTYLESHAADKKLIESLSGIESSFRQINIIHEKTEEKKIELNDTEKTLSDAEQSLLIRKKEMDNFSNKGWCAITEAERIKKALVDITGGQDISALRALTDKAKDYHDRLRSLLDLVSRIEEETSEYQKHGEKITSILTERTGTEQQHVLLQKEEGQNAQLVKLAEEKLFLQARVKTLEKEREHLMEGTPCPLCGSIDHPWCTGVMPVLDNAEQELNTHKKAREILHKNIRQSEAKLAALDAEVQGIESVRENLRQKIKTATTEFQRECNDLGLVTTGTDLKPAIAAAFDEYRERLEKARETLNHAEEKEREIRRAEDLITREKSDLTEAQRDYDKAMSYRDTKIRDMNRIINEIAATDAEYRRQKGAILNALQEYDIIVFSAHTMAEEILTELTSRRDGYATNLTNKQELEISQQRLGTEVERNISLISGAEKNLKSISEILSKIYEDFKTSSAKRRELYGEKDPTVEEIRLARQVEDAEKKLSEANETKSLADKQKSSCEDQIHTLAEKITRRISVLQEKEQEFFRVLAGSGFTDENHFISARLPSDTLSELEQLETDLMHEETGILTGLREKTSKLAENKGAC